MNLRSHKYRLKARLVYSRCASAVRAVDAEINPRLASRDFVFSGLRDALNQDDAPC